MKIFKNLFKKAPFIPYELFGEKALKELVEDFYTIMETDPKAKRCLNAHELENGKVPGIVKERLFMFLSGWTGGPNLFVQNRGAPRMRMRHAPFQIGQKEKEEWLYCMDRAMDLAIKKKGGKLKKKKHLLMRSFEALANRIQNS